jgi:hypothetical protein
LTFKLKPSFFHFLDDVNALVRVAEIGVTQNWRLD